MSRALYTEALSWTVMMEAQEDTWTGSAAAMTVKPMGEVDRERAVARDGGGSKQDSQQHAPKDRGGRPQGDSGG